MQHFKLRHTTWSTFYWFCLNLVWNSQNPAKSKEQGTLRSDLTLRKVLQKVMY